MLTMVFGTRKYLYFKYIKMYLTSYLLGSGDRSSNLVASIQLQLEESEKDRKSLQNDIEELRQKVQPN